MACLEADGIVEEGRRGALPPGDEPLPPGPRLQHGRGAVSNPTGRYEPAQREAMDDGWGEPDELPPLRTEVLVDKARTVITRNASPDIPFDRSINPYRGCEHGCVYCFARPTHAYVGLSPGLDFESRLFAKPDAAVLLEKELSRPGYTPRTLAIGTNTDPYQPIERQYQLMRGILEVLGRMGHPVSIVTKSALVTRDIDLLAPMASQGLACVAISVTTLDGKLARTMEPRAAAPHRRLAAIRQLGEAGIPVSVMVAPIIPAINDSEIETILEKAHEAGAREAGYVLLRLPLEVRDLVTEWLVTHYPDKARHVLSLIRSMRGGKDYDARWNERMTGTGPYAALIARRFELAMQRIGYLKRHPRLRTDLFRGAPKAAEQLSLF
ncbi:DNA repair photolyase [Pseudochelatococcus lubricantis]|uniref:DNA repair photolyase n=1 Tax=Pseudochelatococcus lubricantis TaxID=1538102 RepID=A0ABX0UYI0_9HYPH|nr:PA0069 family radical SAM protein [Pseudochelatococcus lubricantis]NIJ57433.1 DNA repair photolyase [Pseudochelatococcus lubricantis]